MSRGLGKVELAVLDALADRPKGTTTTELAREFYGSAPTSAQLVTLRQSIRSLARKELVTVRRELANVVRLRRPGKRG